MCEFKVVLRMFLSQDPDFVYGRDSDAGIGTLPGYVPTQTPFATGNSGVFFLSVLELFS